MARTVKPEKFAAKRNEILDTALRLVMTKGFEQMAIQEILDQLGISAGAFHHYFDSRAALLEALIERMQGDLEQQLLAFIDDPNLSAPEKLQRFLDTIDRLRSTRKDVVLDLLHIWYSDDNAVVRQKVDAMIVERRAPLLNGIVRQGIQEGFFTTPYPEQCGEIILSLLQGMGSTHARLLLSVERASTGKGANRDTAGAIIAVYAANMTAIECVLGTKQPFLNRVDEDAVKEWLVALEKKKTD